MGTGSAPCREGSPGVRAAAGTHLVADCHPRMPKRTRSLKLGALIGLGHYPDPAAGLLSPLLFWSLCSVRSCASAA